MSDLNNQSLTGRLTRDAQLKTLPSGTQLCEFTLANNTGFGQYAKTSFFDVKMIGKGAPGLAPYLLKGQLVGVSGELAQERWTGTDGVEKTKWVLTTMQVSLLGSKEKEGYTSGPIPGVDREAAEAKLALMKQQAEMEKTIF